MDVSTKHLAEQVSEREKAYDNLRSDCLRAARLYGELTHGEDLPDEDLSDEDLPKAVVACARIPSRKDETPEALGVMFDNAFAAFAALASYLDREQSYGGLRCSSPFSNPQALLEFVGERVEAHRVECDWERRFARARAHDQAETMGYVGHPLFRANARSTSKGILLNAMQSALRDGKWHFGEFATFQWQQLWRFDVFPGNASRAWQKNLDAEMEAWSQAGSETNTQPIDGLFDCTYVDGEGMVREGFCWVRVAFKVSTMKTVMTVLGPVQQVGFGIHETDQYDDKAGYEMQPARYRE